MTKNLHEKFEAQLRLETESKTTEYPGEKPCPFQFEKGLLYVSKTHEVFFRHDIIFFGRVPVDNGFLYFLKTISGIAGHLIDVDGDPQVEAFFYSY